VARRKDRYYRKGADKALDALYATMPAITCRGLCQLSCGPILMSRREWERICDRLGHVPEPTKEQASRLVCPMLGDDGKCGVYDIRPVVCRLWACTPDMICPHGCRPERFVLNKEGEHLLRRAQEISDRLYGTEEEIT
jgi:hypothetical protein